MYIYAHSLPFCIVKVVKIYKIYKILQGFISTLRQLHCNKTYIQQYNNGEKKTHMYII